jgi:glycosyltransferase involved in cell wall biosynthesis
MPGIPVQHRAHRALRIAQIAPLAESVPPRLYGGTERVVAHLSDALVALGHDVTLFASGDACTQARLFAVRNCAVRLDPAPLKSDMAAHLTMLHEVRARESDFDVLHFHVDLIHFPFFEAVAGRTVTTLHGRLDVADLADAYRRWPEYPLVSISHHQRRPLAFANWVENVQHGLPTNLFDYSPMHRGYVAFVGRISPEKRPDRAVEIARRAGIGLRIAAKVDAVDVAYFREVVRPLLAQPHVEFIGEIGDAGKNDLLGGAAALLFPIDWPEPFGLVMIEAMACGTPVIAWDNGSVPEVVEHGVTGFIVRSIDEAVAALMRIETLDRARIRATFERRFSAARMSKDYVRLYTRLARAGCGHRDDARYRREDRTAWADRAIRP